MRRRVLAWAAILVLAVAAPALALPKCTPTTPTHERWPVKTRPTPPAPVTSTSITVAGLIAEDIPAIQGLPNTAVAGTDEGTIYNLRAYVMLVKLSTDDCDIHMEVANTPDPSAPRVIVEVPAKQAGVQNLVAKLLKLTKIPTGGKTYTATTALHLFLMGYGFFDVSHKTLNGNKADNHGTAKVATMLELPPVFAH